MSTGSVTCPRCDGSGIIVIIDQNSWSLGICTLCGGLRLIAVETAVTYRLEDHPEEVLLPDIWRSDV